MRRLFARKPNKKRRQFCRTDSHFQIFKFSNFQIAFRFLFSPKSHSVVNIISRVAMVAVGVPVAAMIILMSVFNGFDGLIKKMYAGFDPDLTIVPREGAIFAPENIDIEAIKNIDEICKTSLILVGNALLERGASQQIATVRGVDSLAEGAILGQGLAYELGIGYQLDTVKFYAPSRDDHSILMPTNIFRTGELQTMDLFSFDAATDRESVFVPLDFAQDIFDYAGLVSAVTVRLASGADEKKIQSEVGKIAGKDFEILTREELHPSMYRIMKMEKWAIFFIGLMVLVIASFSTVGSLVMLIIDKQKGTDTIRALGMNARAVRGVFVIQGMMTGGIGIAGGLILGVIVCAVQQIFGVIAMPGSTFLMESYPVDMRALDIAAICAASVTVNWIITIFTVKLTFGK